MVNSAWGLRALRCNNLISIKLVWDLKQIKLLMLVRQLFIMKSWEINPSVKAEIKKKKKSVYQDESTYH